MPPTTRTVTRRAPAPSRRESTQAGRRVQPAAVAAPEDPRDRLLVTIHEHGMELGRVLVSSGSSPIVVGRREGSGIRVRERGVSAVHGVLKHDETGWSFTDANSTNGSYAVVKDGSAEHLLRVDVTLVEPGSVLQLGMIARLEFSTPPAERGSTSSTDVSAAAQGLARDVARAARSSDVVLLLGASGTGKTFTARRIHQQGARPGRFVPVNCAGLPLDRVALDVRFHGAAPGGYTGAVKGQKGLLAEAAGGTLFLDEVESLSPDGQGFLLDVLDGSRTFRPLGASHDHVVKDLRIIAATKARLKKTPLRQDLVYRLMSGRTIHIPGLDQRREDIAGFMDMFAREAAQELRVDARASIAAPAYRWAEERAWPGELRSLHAVVRNAVQDVSGNVTGPLYHVTRDALQEAARRYDADLGERHDTDEVPLARVAAEIQRREFKATARLTADDLAAALKQNGGKLGPTARALGIALNTLKSKLQKFGMR